MKGDKFARKVTANVAMREVGELRTVQRKQQETIERVFKVMADANTVLTQLQGEMVKADAKLKNLHYTISELTP